jgi:hypothetical protein
LSGNWRVLVYVRRSSLHIGGAQWGLRSRVKPCHDDCLMYARTLQPLLSTMAAMRARKIEAVSSTDQNQLARENKRGRGRPPKAKGKAKSKALPKGTAAPKGTVAPKGTAAPKGKAAAKGKAKAKAAAAAAAASALNSGLVYATLDLLKEAFEPSSWPMLEQLPLEAWPLKGKHGKGNWQVRAPPPSRAQLEVQLLKRSFWLQCHARTGIISAASSVVRNIAWSGDVMAAWAAAKLAVDWPGDADGGGGDADGDGEVDGSTDID